MADTREITVPDIGDYTDVPVIEVLVSEGQEVSVDDPLIVLESDKATMEVPADVAGVIERLALSVGDEVSQGTLIVTVRPGDDDGSPASEDEEESGADDGPDEAPEDEPREDAEDEPREDTEDEPREDAEPDDDGPPAEATSAGSDAPVYASPSVRRLAREKGIDLTTVTGTGRKGRITPEDLEGASTPAAADVPEAEGDERVPLARFTRIAAPGLTRNWQEIPHVTQFDDADVTDLEKFRKDLNAERDARVTMVALTMVACAATLREFPHVNARLDGTDLIVRSEVNIGFAADTPDGLLVPVIRDVDRKGILEVSAELRELAGRAREGKVSREEMEGGTFTISSLGGIGGTHFTPIINAPELAILGVGRNRMQPEWDGEQFVPRLMMPLSLSYDHRAVDGAAGARFITHLVELLGDIRKVLL